MLTYRHAAWLIKRLAVSVLPSVANLKTLRVTARGERAKRAMVGFADPALASASATPLAQAPDNPKNAPRITPAYADYWPGAGIDLARFLPELSDTADELVGDGAAR